MDGIHFPSFRDFLLIRKYTDSGNRFDAVGSMEGGVFLEAGKGVHVNGRARFFPQNNSCQGFTQRRGKLESMTTESHRDEKTFDPRQGP